VSDSTLTPGEKPSEEGAVEFATIPAAVSLKQLFHAVHEAVHEDVPLLEAVEQLRAEGWTGLPELVAATPPAWTPTQQQALASLVRLDDSRRVWMGSLEITELIRRHLQQEVTSAAPPGGPGPGAAAPIVSISSPLGEEFPGPSAAPSFWLTINAELVLYGATEADAAVRVAGRRIRLRPDGTFSYRFALPDGQYPLELTARSADGQRGRLVHLHFGRITKFQGEVGMHQQDPKLKPPVDSSFP